MSTDFFPIAISSTAGNVLISTTSGYGVFVDDSSISTHGGSTIYVVNSPTGGLYDSSTGEAIRLSSTSGLSTNSTGLYVISTSGGTVTSVGLSTSDAYLTISGSPVTGAGTIGLNFAVEPSTTFFAGPISGAASTPGFRSITSTDLSSTMMIGNDLYLYEAAGNSTILASGPAQQLYYSTAGNSTSVDWGAGKLWASGFSTAPTVNWEAGVLNDASGVTSFYWTGRQLVNSANTVIATWGGLFVVQTVSTAPGSTTAGGLYFNTSSSTLQMANGTAWSTVGTVTSAGLSLPAQFSVTGSPVTSSGTLTAVWINENSTLVFAGPSSGAAGAPTFRPLVSSDIPPLAYLSTIGISSMPAGFSVSPATISSGGGGSFAISYTNEASTLVLAGPSSGAAAMPTFRTLLSTDLPAVGSGFFSTNVLPVVSTAPGSPSDGQAWYNSTTKRAAIQAATVTTEPVLSYGALFANNTLTASTGVQYFALTNLNLPANFFNTVNQALRVKFLMLASVGVANTYTIGLYSGTTAIWTQALGTFTGTGAQIIGELDILCSVIGSTGQLAVFPFLIGNNATLVPPLSQVTYNPGTVVNLTSSMTLQFGFTATSTSATDNLNQPYSNWQLIQ